MSSVKISGLPVSSNLNVNPTQSVFPTTDLGTGQTTRLDAKSLGSTLYANNNLTVGTGGILLPNLVAQFTGISSGYTQVNEQNINNQGTADYIVTADIGSDTNYYIDMGITNSQYSNASPFNSLGTAIEPLSGYLYVQGNATYANSGNLVIGTVNPGTETRLFAGGVNANNVVLKIKPNEIKAVANTIVNVANTILVNTITFYDGTSTNSFSAVANATANISYITGVNLTQNTNIQIANTTANNALANTIALQTYSGAAFAKANAALANATGIFAGDLTITGNTIAQAMNTANLIVNGTANVTGTLNVFGVVSMNAQVVLTNTSFSATQAALTIAASNTVAIPSQDGYMIHVSGKQNVASRIISDSFGANTYVVYAGRTARGNVTNPSAVQTNDVLSRFSGNGYGTTKYQPLGVGRIDFVATENYTDANTGSQIQFWTTPAGSNTVTQIATFNGTSVTFTGTVGPQKGFIYTPLVYPSAQTAITIDMANNSLVRAQTATGLTVTLSNLTAGKEVVAWITNTAGFSQTFTHGVSATNSTVNATTYSIPSTSTILARYMSIDGTAQNTFVAITHS
jgi:hypothetical protein